VQGGPSTKLAEPKESNGQHTLPYAGSSAVVIVTSSHRDDLQRRCKLRYGNLNLLCGVSGLHASHSWLRNNTRPNNTVVIR
jgi:hypothetical protein